MVKEREVQTEIDKGGYNKSEREGKEMVKGK